MRLLQELLRLTACSFSGPLPIPHPLHPPALPLTSARSLPVSLPLQSFQTVTEDLKRRFAVNGEPLIDESVVGSLSRGASPHWSSGEGGKAGEVWPDLR